MIVIVNYGLGNLGAIKNALTKLGVSSKLTSSYKDILSASKIILPGVGAFDEAAKNLMELGLGEAICEKAEKGTPVLGICLGLHLLTEKSEEGEKSGLGLIRGKTIKFSFKEASLKVPHIGWNTVQLERESPLFRGLEKEGKLRFYFLHSYHVICEEENSVVGWTNYGYNFASVIQKDSIFGVQFHPEKSHKIGINVLKNFVRI